MIRRGWFASLWMSLAMSASIHAAALAQTGTAVPLYQFTDGADGGEPVGGVVMDSSGTLYGETSAGGAAPCTSKAGQPSGGCGTVYSFSPTAGLKVLATFTGPNGAYGMNTLTLVGSTLYGTTQNGGTNDDGVIFSVHTDGSDFTILHQFSGPDGQYPASILRKGNGNILYGITENGGSNGDGVLYSITPSGTYNIIHEFAGGTKDGRIPFTLLISSSGIIVGSTESGGEQKGQCSYGGCGTIFTYTPSTKQYSVAYDFNGTSALGGIIGSLGPNSTVYGNGYGSPYSLNSETGLVDIGSFADTNVDHYSGPLLAPSGALIGVLGSGQISPGILYSAANGVTTTLYYFDTGFGGDPLSQPILLPSGNLIGTNVTGGLCGNCGAIWEYTP